MPQQAGGLLPSAYAEPSTPHDAFDEIRDRVVKLVDDPDRAGPARGRGDPFRTLPAIKQDLPEIT